MALFELEDKENEQIQSFSETPAPTVKPKEVTEAEDQIKDEEKDDEDDDKEYREQHNDDDSTTDDTSDLGTDTGTDESIATEDTDKNTEDTSAEDEDTASVAADLHATDEDDDKDKSKIATAFYRMSVYDILHTRMIKFEYGTQAGTPDPGCAGCSPGTADAADAAIIDSEVEPAEPTVDNTNNGSGGTGGDLGGGDLSGGDDLGGDHGGDLGGDLGSSFYAKMMSPYDIKPKWYEVGLEEYVPTFNNPETANYGIGGLLKDIVSVVGDTIEGAVPIVKKCANYLSVAGKRAAKGMMTTKALAKFYRWKFKKYLSYVDEEKLKSMKVDALPAKNWVGMSKGCIEISKAISSVNVDKVSGDDFKKIMTVLTAKFKLIGVNMTATDDRAKFEGFNKARKGGTVYELGYTPDAISNYFQELEYLGGIVSPARTKQFTAMFSELGNSIKKVVSKNKKAVEVYSARFSYITKCRETLLTICDELIDELKHVASAYEVCMDTDRGDQETDKADGAEK